MGVAAANNRTNGGSSGEELLNGWTVLNPSLLKRGANPTQDLTSQCLHRGTLAPMDPEFSYYIQGYAEIGDIIP